MITPSWWPRHNSPASPTFTQPFLFLLQDSLLPEPPHTHHILPALEPALTLSRAPTESFKARMETGWKGRKIGWSRDPEAPPPMATPPCHRALTQLLPFRYCVVSLRPCPAPVTAYPQNVLILQSPQYVAEEEPICIYWYNIIFCYII